MATSQRASRSLCDTFSRAVAPRYVCRTCRSHIVQPNVKQIRQATYSTGARENRTSLRPKAWIQRGGQPGTAATYATTASRSQKSLAESEPSAATDGYEEAHTWDGYEEAHTWDGLEHVGHQGHWRDLPPRPQDDYEPWLVAPAAPVVDRNEFLGYLYVALVEKLPYKGQNPALQQTTTDRTLDESLPIDVSSLQIKLSDSGTFSHLEDKTGAGQGKSDTTAAEASTSSEGSSRPFEISVAAMEEQLSGARFDFSSPLSFQILKRFSQLSGFRVPDPVLNAVLRGNKTALEFVELLTQSSKPKPKSVAEALIMKQKQAFGVDAQPSSTSAAVEAPNKKNTPPKPLGPNVMVLSRRETPVDKEKEVGRWKVIERELKARGLPVLGHKVLAPQGEAWNETLKERRL
ncbi:hypothetical protein A1O1_03358 [Capronia coronata CBS 617.96]|uniref:Uncharacterized protein n=1 Tax=Capronia coronata CBS 617.96 TaxID=1182541 RepID=W9Z6W3_9EURO|nr:uncharacterized protein A1O1_03358 [Capronia coronata CBS 617.96]EXJ90259.1 hypothetical protein A1O1_03358 [Capronia coronata CBS 617.96]